MPIVECHLRTDNIITERIFNVLSTYSSKSRIVKSATIGDKGDP